MSSDVQRALRTLGVTVAVALLVAIAALAWRSIEGFQRRAELVEHTHVVRLELQAFQASFSSMRWQWRSYLASGNEDMLRAYRLAASELPAQLELLRALTTGEPRQHGRLEKLGAALARNLAALDAAVQRQRGGRIANAAELVEAVELGNVAVAEVEALTREMMREQNALLEERHAESERSARLTKLVLLLGNGAALALLAGAFLLLRREVGQRRTAELTAQRYAAEVEDLYDNAPCGYHSVDAEGRIVRMNQTWLDWLGYRREEVIGRLRHPELMTAASAQRFAEEAFPAFLRQGWVREIEFEYRRRDGSTFPATLSATAVHDAQGRIVRSRSTVFDISERKRAEDALRQLNASLNAANAELESFSYSVSHDLRAPLRAIDGYARMLEEDYGASLDDEGRRLLGVVRANSRQMARLIEDLLAFSRLGRSALNKARLDMAALAHEVAAELAGAQGAARVVLGELPHASADRSLLRQVWANLIGNALKYSARSAEPLIEIGARAEDAETVYWVRDNGVGFDMRYAQKLFGVFQRLHAPEEFEGTGVGLAIVQRVVTRHGGRVWAEGQPGEGATFFFSLPAEATT